MSIEPKTLGGKIAIVVIVIKFDGKNKECQECGMGLAISECM